MAAVVRTARLLAWHDLVWNLRQRETLLWVFVMPVVFFYFIGTVTGGFGGGGQTRPSLLLDGAAGDPVVEAIRGRLEEQGYAVRWATGEDDRDRRVLRIAPPDGQPSVTAAIVGGIPVVATLRRRGEGPGVEKDRVAVARAVYATLADLVLLADSGIAPSDEAIATLRGEPRPLRLEVSSAGRRREPPRGFAQAIPGTLVMFTMLALLTGGVIPQVVERELGLLRRLASAPLPRAGITVGKWLARMALGLVQIGFAMVAGRVLFGMDWGGSLGMVVLVLVAWAGFNASLAGVIANLVRTQAQAAGIGVIATMALAALGGCWWPIEITPAWMQRLAITLPTGWAMDAMHRLVSFADPATAALPHLAALVAGAVVLGAIGARTFRYD